jgi:hypothetical protein
MRRLLTWYRGMSDETVNRLTLALMVLFTFGWVLPEIWVLLKPYLWSAISPPPLPIGPRC